MKRFWKTAVAAPAAHGLTVLLDGRPMRIPGGTPLVLHGAALAQAIAEEWQNAGMGRDSEMSMDDVPLTRLAGTAQDRVAPNHAAVAAALAQYAETDLLCYRAEHPEALVVRQAHAWQPWLDWLARAHDARLRPAAGIVHVKQDPAALQAVHRVMSAQTDPVLAALGVAIPALGSAVLGLALAEGALDAAAAHELAMLDELFQVENWGDDAEAARRRSDVAADIGLAARFIGLSRAP